MHSWVGAVVEACPLGMAEAALHVERLWLPTYDHHEIGSSNILL